MKKNIKDTIVNIFTDEFEGFSYVKGKGMWIQETNDDVLLLIAYQASWTNMVFYLNFGVYFRALVPLSRPPKVPDWHLFARYERFAKIPVAEFNRLFSLEDEDLESLEKRCSDIAAFSKEIIIPKLRCYGDYQQMREKLTSTGTQIFEPFWAQNVTKAEIVSHILGVKN